MRITQQDYIQQSYFINHQKHEPCYIIPDKVKDIVTLSDKVKEISKVDTK